MNDIEKQKIERFNQIADIVNCHLIAGKNNYKEKSECFDDISKIILDSYEHKQLNNADRIRNMSNEELMEFLSHIRSGHDVNYGDWVNFGHGIVLNSCDTDIESRIRDWLQSEAE